MLAYTYRKKGVFQLLEKPTPKLEQPEDAIIPVSYTHLDVYKRQRKHRRPAGSAG